MSGVDTPGPLVSDVLYAQKDHISESLWNFTDRGDIHCCEHTNMLSEWVLQDQRQILLIERAGFGHLSRLGSFPLDHALISALVERWRKETNTFHLPVGEVALTLHDVKFLYGLSIDGEAVTGIQDNEFQNICRIYLGTTVDKRNLVCGSIKLKWLRDTFHQLPENANDQQIQWHTRAYILYLMGCTIFCDRSGGRVDILYLPLLRDLESAGRFAWGAAALAFLYRSLGHACHKDSKGFSGSMTLLQCWAFEHISVVRPPVNTVEHFTFPLAVGWRKALQKHRLQRKNITELRVVLDELPYDEFVWRPYDKYWAHLQPFVSEYELEVSYSNTILICFDVAEWYLPNRFAKHFGFRQQIPLPVSKLKVLSKKGRNTCNWETKLADEIACWNERHNNLTPNFADDLPHRQSDEYLQWYYPRTIRRLVRKPSSHEHVQGQPSSIESHLHGSGRCIPGHIGHNILRGSYVAMEKGGEQVLLRWLHEITFTLESCLGVNRNEVGTTYQCHTNANISGTVDINNWVDGIVNEDQTHAENAQTTEGTIQHTMEVQLACQNGCNEGQVGDQPSNVMGDQGCFNPSNIELQEHLPTTSMQTITPPCTGPTSFGGLSPMDQNIPLQDMLGRMPQDEVEGTEVANQNICMQLGSDGLSNSSPHQEEASQDLNIQGRSGSCTVGQQPAEFVIPKHVPHMEQLQGMVSYKVQGQNVMMEDTTRKRVETAVPTSENVEVGAEESVNAPVSSEIDTTSTQNTSMGRPKRARRGERSERGYWDEKCHHCNMDPRPRKTIVHRTSKR